MPLEDLCTTAICPIFLQAVRHDCVCAVLLFDSILQRKILKLPLVWKLGNFVVCASWNSEGQSDA